MFALTEFITECDPATGKAVVAWNDNFDDLKRTLDARRKLEDAGY